MGQFYGAAAAGGYVHGQLAESGDFAEAKFPDIAVRVTETTRMTGQTGRRSVLEKMEVPAPKSDGGHDHATTGQAIESEDHPRSAAGDAELPAVADAVVGRAERAECGGATGPWQRRAS